MDIAAWLRELGLERYQQAFLDNDVDVGLLPDLAEADLEKLGVASLGHRKMLLRAIEAPRAPGDELAAGATAIADEALLAQPPPGSPPEAERRQLTVLFCDLVGSTKLSGALDPEEMGAVIRAYQNTVSGETLRFEGHIAKFMGDGVLAYFGWPQAHEDDAERAVRSGLALVRAVAGLEAAGQPLAARVGIATGLVMVGELVGEGAAQERAVVGETPNLAARLQALSAPGGVVISQATRRLVGRLFELTDLGPTRLKGFAEPLAAFRVEGEGRADGRFEALHGERLTPLIGREHELAMLLERWRRAQDRDGQVVLIAGDAGIGKSRLLRALREQLAGEPHVVLRHFCSPYHTNSALHPVIAQLERAAGIASHDEIADRLAKLEALLGQATASLDEAVPLIGALLGIATSDRYAPPNLSPQRQKQRTLEILIEQLAGLARERPVLELYEDVHWVDPSTLELLDLLVERIRALPVLLVLTYRRDFTPPWTGQSHVTALTMNRLGRRQGAALVEGVTGARSLPAEVLDQIVARTDGVPLFIEELTKTVLESGLLTDAGDHYELSRPLPPLAIPATLHDSLMARLDRLAPVKELAQAAAAIGREFSHDLLAAVSPMSEAALGSALDHLIAAELIFRRGSPPDATYSFKHALVQDAAYQSLVKSRRQQLHTLIAQTLEREFPDTPPEVLAHHFTEAGLDEKAVGHWYAAGQSAAGRSAYREAVALFRRGLEVLERAAQAVWSIHEEIRLNIALAGSLLAFRGPVPEVLAAFTRARDLSLEINEQQQLSLAMYGLWLVSFRQAEFEIAAQVSRDILTMFKNAQDTGLVLEAHHAMWTTSLYRAELETGRHHAEIGARLYRAEVHHQITHGYGSFHDAGVCCRGTRAIILWLLGYPDRAVTGAQDCLELAQQLGHPNSLALALEYASLVHRFRHEPAAVKEHARTLIDLAKEHDLPFRLAAGMRHEAWSLLADDETEEALRQIERGLAISDAIGSKVWRSDFLTVLAEACLRVDRHDRALAAIDQALDFVSKSGERCLEAEIHRLRGVLQLTRQDRDLAEAEDCFRQALSVARQQSAKSLELRAATSLARLWRDHGKQATAYDLLAPVYDWFTEGFGTADLREAKALLDQLG